MWTEVRRKCAVAGMAILASLACGEPETPESRVRAALVSLESAIEAGDVGAFRDGISAQYRDAQGHDSEAVANFLRAHILRNQRGREVFLRIRDVQFTSEAGASVALHAGIAGAGEDVRANAYAVDLDLALESDEWRVVWAQWKPAAPAELL